MDGSSLISFLFLSSTQPHVQGRSILKTGQGQSRILETIDHCVCVAGGGGVLSCNFRRVKVAVSLFSYFALLSFLSLWLVRQDSGETFSSRKPGGLAGAPRKGVLEWAV